MTDAKFFVLFFETDKKDEKQFFGKCGEIESFRSYFCLLHGSNADFAHYFYY